MTVTSERPSLTRARYLTLTTGTAGRSAPILFASNPVGGALLSSGLISLAGASAASMVPILPVRMSGIDVDETLFQFDVETQADDGAVSGLNRAGAALGVLQSRWLIAPDHFDPTISTLPVATELETGTSQRLVMADGVLRLQDRLASGVRFFGAGRTYPSLVEGAPRLFFAAAAVVVEGLGALKGLRGSLTFAGEISGASLVAFTVSGRFDDDGPLEAVERAPAIVADHTWRSEATVLTLVGETGRSVRADHLEETLRATRVTNELGLSSRPRSFVRIGGPIGAAVGRLRFDPAEFRCAVRLPDCRRDLAFTDAAGDIVATVTAETFEGTAFRDPYAGEGAARLIAYGRLTGGSGALAGAAGVLTLDTAVTPDGAAATVYTVWLSDPRGRFRAAPETTGVEPPAEPAAPPLLIAEASARTMLAEDRDLAVRAERALARGSELLAWFREKERFDDYVERFAIARDTGTSEMFGFFDRAVVGGAPAPVMGVVHEMFYDREKQAVNDAVRAQLQLFVLRYFTRLCGGYAQLLYKRADTAEVGKFALEERPAVVDLRDIGPIFSWIVLQTDALSYDVPFAPFGADTPHLEVPVQAPTSFVIGPSFVTSTEVPYQGAIATYGFAHAFVPRGGGFGIQTFDFRLMTHGEIRARTALVVNRSEKITALDVDPIGWGVQLADLMTFRLASRFVAPMLALAERLPLRASGVDPVSAYIWMANTLTAGAAAERFGISRPELEKRMLLQQFKQQEEVVHRSLQIWRMVPDWTEQEHLPEFCRRGVAS